MLLVCLVNFGLDRRDQKERGRGREREGEIEGERKRADGLGECALPHACKLAKSRGTLLAPTTTANHPKRHLFRRIYFLKINFWATGTGRKNARKNHTVNNATRKSADAERYVPGNISRSFQKYHFRWVCPPHIVLG